MECNKEIMIRASERFVKLKEDYLSQQELGPEKNNPTDYIILNSKEMFSEKIIVYAHFDVSMICFEPFKIDDLGNISLVCDWSFSFDDNLFGYLNKNYELLIMSPDSHIRVWCSIAETNL